MRRLIISLWRRVLLLRRDLPLFQIGDPYQPAARDGIPLHEQLQRKDGLDYESDPRWSAEEIAARQFDVDYRRRRAREFEAEREAEDPKVKPISSRRVS